jgi:hypothetical protein
MISPRTGHHRIGGSRRLLEFCGLALVLRHKMFHICSCRSWSEAAMDDVALKVESPEDIVKCMVLHDESIKGNFFKTKAEAYIIITMISISGMAIIVAILSNFFWNEYFKPVAFILAALCQLSSMIYQFYVIGWFMRDFRHPVRLAVHSILDLAPDDLQFVERLTRCDRSRLQYCLENLDLDGKHLRSRISVFIGALENIGIVPATVTWCIALFKVLVEHHDGVLLNSNFVLYSGIFLGIFYGVAFVGAFVNHRIERLSLRIRTAISLIDQREKSLGPVA